MKRDCQAMVGVEEAEPSEPERAPECHLWPYAKYLLGFPGTEALIKINDKAA